MMDHGRFPPFSLAGGTAGAMTEIEVSQGGTVTRPPHVSKGTGYVLAPGDWVQVKTPGGGGWGDPRKRDRERVERDVRRGYIAPSLAAATYGWSENGVSPDAAVAPTVRPVKVS
jgi:N-methylhydantoinase B